MKNLLERIKEIDEILEKDNVLLALRVSLLTVNHIIFYKGYLKSLYFVL